jgi:hypothetical protein
MIPVTMAAKINENPDIKFKNNRFPTPKQKEYMEKAQSAQCIHDLVKFGFHPISGYFLCIGPQKVGNGFTFAQNFFRCSSDV